MVAAEAPVRVEDECDVALPAAAREAAGATVQSRGDAAPVEEEDRLAAPGRDRVELRKQGRG